VNTAPAKDRSDAISASDVDSDGIMAADRSGSDGEVASLLAGRARIAMWVVVASNLLFALTDLRLSWEAFRLVAGLKLLQVFCGLAGLGALRAGLSRRAVIAVILVEAALVSGLTAWSGAVADDIATTMILWIAASFGATVLLPWGALSQLGFVVIAAMAMLLNVYLARGTLEPAMLVPAVGVFLTLAVSVAIANRLERQRRALAAENARRAEAEAALRRANEGLDRKVEERTRALVLANDRLEEARLTSETAEQRFRAISNLTSDYAYSVRLEPDLSSVIEWITARPFERLTGYSMEEVNTLGGGLALVHTDDMPIAVRRLAVLLAGEADISEFRIVRKDGEVRWIREHGHPEWDAEHTRVVRLLGAAEDVTEQRLAEHRLTEALRQRENVMNTVPDIIYTLGCDGYLQSWNRRFEVVTGRTAEEIPTTPVLELFAEEDRAAVAAAIQQVFDTGDATVEAGVLVPGGVRSYYFTGARLLDERGEVTGITGVGRDITELKELQERTQTLLEVARDISGTLEFSAVLERVQLRTAALLPCEMVATFCWDEQRGGLCMASQHGFPAPLAEALARLSFPMGVPFGGRLAAGETIVMDDAREVPGIGPLLPHGALVVAPMLRGRYLGALVALRSEARPFGAPQIALCEGIAAQVAVALEVSELYQAQREEAQIGGALARAGQELIAALDNPDLLDRLCRVTAEAIGADASCVLLEEPDKESFRIVAASGFTDEVWQSLRTLRFPREAMARMVEGLAEHEIVQFDMATPPEAWAAVPERYGFRSVSHVALRRGKETIGVLVAGFRDFVPALSAARKRMLLGIAQLASFALEHVRASEAREEASRLKSEFVATMSHELRTPLNIILGYNEMLQEGVGGPLSPGQAEIVGRVRASARELSDLIGETLDLSRLESGRLTLDCSLVPLAEVLAEVEAETLGFRDKSAVRVEWDIEPELPPVWIDRGKLKIVVKNLLTNAYKFTDAGTVRVRAAATDTRLIIAVADTGIGIPADAIESIFEPFRQVDSSATRSHGGVGLGLHIVRRLLDLMGGSIHVSSEVGVGSTFRIELPR
jgi:PAS domain S-box-containing protein